MGSVPSDSSLRGVGDGGLLEGHCGLHEHAAVDTGAGDELCQGGTKNDALEMRISAVLGLTRDDPHDVAG
eukprot:CAMPEP_0173076110 /NCGR_PEP_ID=MMETSP1102-20130122/12150_1 /TAXON_ID=49646 /ORGANISM="Geminigera sp., Strain Caron Lab Isolate" /LENGTH=69 /DNA_ID=CAMNT_0013945773 /DNA_START=612 /DNA_END=822 /DNA_ORIENTATION=+